MICRIGWTRSWQREWNGFSPPLTAVQAGCQGVHDSVIYLDAPHLSWINGYKFSLSFDRGRLLLLSNKAILPPPARANDVERRVNEAVCPLFYAPPSSPSAFFFLQLPLCRNDPFVLPLPSVETNHQSHVIRGIDRSQTMDVFLEIGWVKV